MLKKILSLSLALCMILSLAAIVPVGATTTNTYFDNFDETVGEITETGKRYTSDAFVTTTASTLSANVLSFAEGEGVGGSDALKLTVSSGNRNGVIMQPAPFSSTESMLATYKVKFLTLPTALTDTAASATTKKYNSSWLILGNIYSNATTFLGDYGALSTGTTLNSISYAYKTALNPAFTIETGKWYTVVQWAYLYNNASPWVSTTVFDEQGNLCFSCSGSGTPKMSTAYYSPLYIDGRNMATGSTAEVLLDDCYLYQYTASAQGPSVVPEKSSINDGDTNVAVNEEFTICFDQRCFDVRSSYLSSSQENAERAKIYKAGDETNTVDFTYEFGEDRFTITPSEDLEPGTDYVIDLSAVQNRGEVAAGDSAKITFTTAGGQTTTGTTIKVDGAEYTVTKPEGEALVATGYTPAGTVTSLSMTIDSATVTVAKNAWQQDVSGALKIANSLITANAAFTTDTAELSDEVVSVRTVKVGKNAAQTSLYMLGQITAGVPYKYGVRLGCSVEGLSDDYDAAGTNAEGYFLVELGYGSELPADTYSLTAYAKNTNDETVATGNRGTVTVTITE